RTSAPVSQLPWPARQPDPPCSGRGRGLGRLRGQLGDRGSGLLRRRLALSYQLRPGSMEDREATGQIGPDRVRVQLEARPLLLVPYVAIGLQPAEYDDRIALTQRGDHVVGHRPPTRHLEEYRVRVDPLACLVIELAVGGGQPEVGHLNPGPDRT